MNAVNERVFSAVIVCIALAGLLFASVMSVQKHAAKEAIHKIGTQDLTMRGDAMLSRGGASPPARIELAERLIAAGSENDDLARQLLLSAIDRDAYQPFAWTQIAFLETRQAGYFDASAQEALAHSFDQCPLCDEDLLKWRLTFVLANWENVPEEMRLRAFEGADLLRWWYLDHEFLNQMRQSAEVNGIPFSRYQRRIDTPVRPEEVGR